MDQPTQAAFDPAAPLAPSGRSGKGLLPKITGAIAVHNYATFALIVLLIIVIIALYARQKGWFGLGSGARPSRAFGVGKGKKRAQAADEDSDPETENLIDSINGAIGGGK